MRNALVELKPMNTVVVSTFRRPFLTRLCLEALARAWRWFPGWADKIGVGIAPDGDPQVLYEAGKVEQAYPDVPFVIVKEPHGMTPHDVSKWLLDMAFTAGSEAALYVEDDAILSPDAFVMLEWCSRKWTPEIACACLYHETIPEYYPPEGPNPTLLHFGNGLNTLGGTAFFRQPYLDILRPNWNCKQVEPKGFDYSAHYLMYVNKLFAVYPDQSRSVNLGFEGGGSSREFWQKYCGRSLWTQADTAAKHWLEFRGPTEFPPLVTEEWMKAEMEHRGIQL